MAHMTMFGVYMLNLVVLFSNYIFITFHNSATITIVSPKVCNKLAKYKAVVVVIVANLGPTYTEHQRQCCDIASYITLNCLDFLIYHASHSKNGLQLQLISVYAV